MQAKKPNKNPKQKLPRTKRSIEIFAHFNCNACAKWWGIGDAPQEKITWYCPWCGKKQTIA